MRPGRCARNDGAVLAVILLSLGFISALLVPANIAARRRVAAAEARRDRALLYAAVQDAAFLLLRRLADDPVPEVTHTGEEWSRPLDITHPEGYRIQGRVRDAQDRFDINNLYPERAYAERGPLDVLEDLLRNAGIPAAGERTLVLRDWIDRDEEGSRESDYYRRRGLDAECPNRWLVAAEELQPAEGWTARDILRPDREAADPQPGSVLTLLPVDRTAPIPVNINSAPREVLQGVVGAPLAGWVEALLVFRERQPLPVVPPFPGTVSSAYGADVRRLLTVTSTYFTLEIEATDGLRRTMRLDILARRDREGQVRVVHWVRTSG